MKRTLVNALVALSLVGCDNSQPWTPVKQRDTQDDPQAIRPHYGNPEVHTWWPLAEPEVIALEQVDKAKQGDPYALLALALVASGDQRDSATFSADQDRFDKVVSELKPTIDAADDWHKGYELNRAMHRVFFNAEKTDLAGYQLDQAHVTGIFATGKYNCLSSALLYMVLARAFAIPVRGVLVPTHAFTEIGATGGKILEVETTSSTGFDWVHDERFYKERAENWSSSRGLRPVTLEEYKHREILEPYRFVAHAMLDGRAGANDEDHHRLAEIAALVAPEDTEIQKAALADYINEANDLYDHKAWRTMVKMFDIVGPTLTKLGAQTTDPEVLERLSWVHWYHANSLVIASRPDDAILIMDEGIKGLDPKWKDYASLRKNFLWVLMDQLLQHMHDKNYAAAIKLISPRVELCKSDAQCSENLAIIYVNQAARHEREDDWPAARAALEECVAVVPKEKLCADDLKELKANGK